MWGREPQSASHINLFRKKRQHKGIKSPLPACGRHSVSFITRCLAALLVAGASSITLPSAHAQGVTVSVEARGQTLLVNVADYDDWGIGGRMRVRPDTTERGLSLALSSHLGRAQRDRGQLWEIGLPRYEMRRPTALFLEGKFGDGMAAPRGGGLLAPYLGFSWLEAGSLGYCAGMRLQSSQKLTLLVERLYRANTSKGRIQIKLVFLW